MTTPSARAAAVLQHQPRLKLQRPLPLPPFAFAATFTALSFERGWSLVDWLKWGSCGFGQDPEFTICCGITDVNVRVALSMLHCPGAGYGPEWLFNGHRWLLNYWWWPLTAADIHGRQQISSMEKKRLLRLLSVRRLHHLVVWEVAFFFPCRVAIDRCQWPWTGVNCFNARLTLNNCWQPSTAFYRQLNACSRVFWCNCLWCLFDFSWPQLTDMNCDEPLAAVNGHLG